jgi:hypothetical protein
METLQAQVIEAPATDYERRRHQLFLAGGITNCPDWQREAISELIDIPDLTILNPRRADFDVNDHAVEQEQITWEFKQLKDATEIAVWFSQGSLNPITLYELGIWVNGRPDIPAFIGIDPAYQRHNDVIIQTRLARPDIIPVFSLGALVKGVRAHLLRSYDQEV